MVLSLHNSVRSIDKSQSLFFKTVDLKKNNNNDNDQTRILFN